MLRDILKKLQVKQGMSLLVLNSPEQYISDEDIEIMPGTMVHLRPEKGRKYTFVQMFARNTAELDLWMDEGLNSLEAGALFWVSHPKKSSKLYEDLSRDQGWDVLKKKGYEGVASIAVDDDWSAIRFRPISEDTSTARRKSVMTSTSAPVLRSADERHDPPQELLELLESDKEAKDLFEGLAPSYRQSYIDWIVSAKRQETKGKRLKETIAKLKEGYKNPYAK
ncbi:hypothetical protein JOC77_004043 [Peribacillus deserti]|uniref:Bacteriocin resistance YdeI/OmpD-like protein n=1 Tax=Peribacillus deserti TaxID=673318 RepID=A0ABS2QPG2_9BACI|nr:YdeI/OmpD-associated family protein [Peribacillus deserti]MBM7694579.1 hypothetical protein [Peribacillus deserti]